MQDRFAVRLFRAAKEMGVHTVVETNGHLSERLTDEELETIDLVMLGIKTWGSARHQQLTGKDITPTLDFARRLARRKRPIWIRFVLVPGLTDDTENVRSIATFAATLGNVERVEVLPFHQLGRFKWGKLGLDYKLADVQPPSVEQLESACAEFRAVGLNAD
jgi:pyruvate formate lyase activating enzyme